MVGGVTEGLGDGGSGEVREREEWKLMRVLAG